LQRSGNCSLRRTRRTTLKSDWLEDLERTTTAQGVLRVVGEFIAVRSDVYWCGVPEPLRRPEISTEPQLQQWHHALVQAISAMPTPGSPMQELAVLSLRAAVRLHQIRLKEDAAPTSDAGGLGAAPAPRERFGR
jgi:hypothetical protein